MLQGWVEHIKLIDPPNQLNPPTHLFGSDSEAKRPRPNQAGLSLLARVLFQSCGQRRDLLFQSPLAKPYGKYQYERQRPEYAISGQEKTQVVHNITSFVDLLVCQSVDAGTKVYERVGRPLQPDPLSHQSRVQQGERGYGEH